MDRIDKFGRRITRQINDFARTLSDGEQRELQWALSKTAFDAHVRFGDGASLAMLHGMSETMCERFFINKAKSEGTVCSTCFGNLGPGLQARLAEQFPKDVKFVCEHTVQ
jgi:hypothetical protein